LTEAGLAKGGHIGPTARTAIRKRAINHNSRHRPDAKGFGAFGNARVPHVKNDDIAGWTGSIPDPVDRLFADSAAGAENLDLSLGSHANSLLILKGCNTG
jgi:hypothetical protein